MLDSLTTHLRWRWVCLTLGVIGGWACGTTWAAAADAGAHQPGGSPTLTTALPADITSQRRNDVLSLPFVLDVESAMLAGADRQVVRLSLQECVARALEYNYDIRITGHESPGVNNSKGLIVPFGGSVMTVPGDAGHVINNRVS